ncbi:uncharacterized protein [Dysidea avara]|uniref:uncharacterized protein n=1 Tax=Dysidea avara TaxID=196820 RepID=UPI003321E268
MASNDRAVSGGHYSDGTRYGAANVMTFATKRYGIILGAFLDSALTQDLKNLVPGKRVLDIGCGAGNWCVTAAQYGAKSVDGFDIQPEMVELAKQATSHLDMVHIQVGDAADMPYGDDSFDVAISFLVTCNLPPNGFSKHFQELHRVLVPGGKALLLISTDWSHSRLYTTTEADPSTVKSEIAQILSTVPKYPTTSQVTEAFRNADDILFTCFAVNNKGEVFNVTNINQLSHGQPIWRKTEVMIFPNFFYSEHSTTDQLVTNEFHIDNIENHFVEEKMVIYNGANPTIPMSTDFINYPMDLVYHVSKLS